MTTIRKEEFIIDENGRVFVNDEIEFTLDTFLCMLEVVSENQKLYSNLTMSQKEYINWQYWEELSQASTIEELWEMRDWFEEEIQNH